MEIRLLPDELFLASAVGCRRRIDSILRDAASQLPDRERIQWTTDIDGACAELAACKALGWYWVALAGRQAIGDIGQGVQVRSTRYHDGSLIIRQRDKADASYLFVTCEAPRYFIRGWLTGLEAKTDRYEQTNGHDSTPFWKVPQDELYPFDASRWRELVIA